MASKDKKPSDPTVAKADPASSDLDTRKVYLCGVDWQEHHWAWLKIDKIDAPEIFRSVQELKAKRSCWRQCGIVEVEMRVTGWPVAQTLFTGTDTDSDTAPGRSKNKRPKASKVRRKNGPRRS